MKILSALFRPRFTETTLVTNYGEFTIRVYRARQGKETVVLYTASLDPSHPVLTRVHSECLTGDVFGSRHCDCGEQLHLSLKQIAHEGGVLIYLRQEGRGVGLYDKIRSYALQRKGLDTFEANIKLGHKPDERTYEMVKTVLNDLRISEICLLSNNSEKVLAITASGVSIVKTVPLLISSNNQNQKYLAAKQERYRRLLK